MPDMQQQTQLVLAQNQHALIQDSTKGNVQVYAGPHTVPLSQTDRPVIYNKDDDQYVAVSLSEAVKQNPLVREGDYLVLENPVVADGGGLKYPKQGSNSTVDLQVGRKIVIAGPATFPLWPGQSAQAISGHHLRSNQYLIVRVYNADEATKNAPDFLKETLAEGAKFTPGALLIIKGTDVSFFIPQTGFEVLKDSETGNFVREALTLERLEYCILLDEDGNKRFEIGPQVVFPIATETFQKKAEGNDREGGPNPSGGKKGLKFKAIELNDQMGLYIKVIAEEPAEDVVVPAGAKENDEFFSEKYKVTCVVREMEQDAVDGKTTTPVLVAHFKVGEELFLTGKDRRIYYPQSEHALIQYDDPTKGYKRERYYGITIPTGEGRYVLDKSVGKIKKVEGPQIFLPDPRTEVIVRRVLDDKTVKLWYPGNDEALTFNQSLRALAEESTSYLADSTVLSAAADVSRGMNRGTQYSKALGAVAASGSFEGDKMTRGGKFTPPPMLTLNTKYDGVPAIRVYTGYAVQVVDKQGNRRVEVGPTAFLLEYDESLEVIQLSTGKPKTTDKLLYDVYLRVDHNIISDTINVETKDLVSLKLTVQYRVNFRRENSDKWFNVENYVKYLCDHMRSILKAEAKKHSLSSIMESSAVIIRDTVLGVKNGADARTKFFPENGMEIYEVEVLSHPQIEEANLAAQYETTKRKAVESAMALTADEQSLEITRRRTVIQTEVKELENSVAVRTLELSQEVTKAQAEATMVKLEAEIAEATRRINNQVAEQEQKNQIAVAQFENTKRVSDYELELAKENATIFEKKLGAISPAMIAAMQAFGDTEMMSRLVAAIAPLALHEQQGIGASLDKVFKGTILEPVINNMQTRTAAARAGK